MTAGIKYADRGEWLEARRQGIGGSDAAAIIGVSRWRTPVDVWEDKLGVADEKPSNVRMVWGQRLEDVVAGALTEERGLKMRRVRRILVHPEHPMIIGSVDRLTPDAVVEIKVTRRGDEWPLEEEAPDLPPEKRVPTQYYVQGQHYAGITGRPTVIYGVLVGGNDLRMIPVPADPEFIGDLFTEEVAFWRDYVETGLRPPLSGQDADRLPRIFPRGSGERVATPEVDQAIRELLEVRDREDEYARRRAELEVSIKEYLGDASDLVSTTARATWRNTERTTVGWEPIARGLRGVVENLRSNPNAYVGEALPAILSDAFGTTDLDDLVRLYTSATSYRTFRLDRKGTPR